jgi:hypothetical protein
LRSGSPNESASQNCCTNHDDGEASRGANLVSIRFGEESPILGRKRQDKGKGRQLAQVNKLIVL